MENDIQMGFWFVPNSPNHGETVFFGPASRICTAAIVFNY